MKLEKWALIAQIISAIAIVLSLVFVGLQVRQGAQETALNTRAIQMNAYQDLTAQLSELNALIIGNPLIADLYQRAVVEGEQLPSSPEYQQIRAYFLMAYRQGEMAFRQYQSGLIDEAGLIAMLVPVRVYIQTPMGSDIWRGHGALEPAYKAFVDALPGYEVVPGRE